MIKPLLLLVGMFLLPLTMSAQGVRITEKKVEEVVCKLELTKVEIIDVKTIRKYKALNLSNDMKSQMDYNVVRVKYKARGELKTLLIDRNLVPIYYDYDRYDN
jgi:hypothetical protein